MVRGVISHLELLRGLKKKKLCAHQDPGIHKKLSQTCLECLGVSYGGIGQQWPDTCTEILVSAALGGPVYESYHRAQRQPKNWRRIIPKKSLHCCKIPGPPIAEKRREGKGKGKQERYIHLNTQFQRIARRDQCKVINAKK